MGRGFKVNLGINGLQHKLADIHKYDVDAQRKMRAAVRDTTTKVMLGAKRRVPVKSGNLVSKISMTYDESKNEGKIKAKTFYAHLVEFGAKAVPERNIPKRAEKPYMRPAFEDEKPNLIRGIGEAIR